jgi:hypothetical protein
VSGGVGAGRRGVTARAAVAVIAATSNASRRQKYGPLHAQPSISGIRRATRPPSPNLPNEQAHRPAAALPQAFFTLADLLAGGGWSVPARHMSRGRERRRTVRWQSLGGDLHTALAQPAHPGSPRRFLQYLAEQEEVGGQDRLKLPASAPQGNRITMVGHVVRMLIESRCAAPRSGVSRPR